MDSKIKIKIIAGLLGLAFFLLILNIILDFTVDKSLKVIPEMTADKIQAKVNKVFDDYGIGDEWISNKSVSNPKLDSLKIVTVVNLPSRIPIPAFIKDVCSQFKSNEVEIIADEKQFGVKSFANFIVADKLKYQLQIIKRNELKEDFTSIGLIVDITKDNNVEKLREITSSSIPNTILFKPTREISDLLKSGGVQSVYYNILIGEEGENKYELNIDDSKYKLKSSLISLISDFPRVKYFVISQKSGLYNSALYNYVEDEFSKRGKRIFPLENIVSLSGNSISELISKFTFYENSGKGKGKSNLIISAEDFLNLIPTFKNYLKKGNRFISE